MTRRWLTYDKADRQREIIAALRETGGGHIADRLLKCVDVRLSRRRDAGWPPVCKSVGCWCLWCSPPLARRWWRGVERWVVQDNAPVSLAVLPLHHGSDGLRAAVARLRRALRDFRDRASRRNGHWRGVAIAGMASADRTAVVLVRHAGLERAEVADVLHRRWPDAAIGDVGSLSPSWEFAIEDAVELACARRGVEPIRLVILPQRSPASPLGRDVGGSSATIFEAMPVLI